MFRMVIGDIPRIHAERAPDDLALVDGSRRVTWGGFSDRVTRLANGLREQMGVERGSRVAILANNRLEYADLTFAASQLAAMYTGLNVRHHPREMIDQIKDCGAAVLIVGAGYEDVGAEVAAATNATPLHLDDDGPGESYHELIASASTVLVDPHQDAEAPYVLTYTSGTTGRPKGVMISSRNELAFVQSLVFGGESRRDDRHLIVLPLFHKGGQFSLMHPAYLGLPSVILPSPDAQWSMSTIEQERITTLVAVPTIMKMWVDYLDGAEVEHDLSSMRHVFYGSNPIAPPLLRRFSELFNCSLSQIGGIGTEGGVGLILDRPDHELALNDPRHEHRLTSAGRVQPGVEMRLVDEKDQEVPTGELGEMVFRGDSYVSGYWGRPETSLEAWRGGWFHSGDIGRIDEDGYVYYVDRKAGRIKTGGETVFAREVENTLSNHPVVGAVAVVGVPDDTWGEAVWAVVERNKDVRRDVDAEEIERELQDHARGAIAGYKVPKRVLFVDQLPRTALGKIALGQVRELAMEFKG